MSALESTLGYIAPFHWNFSCEFIFCVEYLRANFVIINGYRIRLLLFYIRHLPNQIDCNLFDVLVERLQLTVSKYYHYHYYALSGIVDFIRIHKSKLQMNWNNSF